MSRASPSRPPAKGSKSGSRPPWARLWTSAVMNTVFPARDRPVTPSRTVGVPPPMIVPRRLSAAIFASSVIVAMADNALSRAPIWDAGRGLQRAAAAGGASILAAGRRYESRQAHRRGPDIPPIAVEVEDRQRRGRETGGKLFAVGRVEVGG